MTVRIAVIVAALAAMAVRGDPAAAQDRMALVVGIDNDTYLLPADTELPNPNDREFVKREAIRLSELIEATGEHHARNRFSYGPRLGQLRKPGRKRPGSGLH